MPKEKEEKDTKKVAKEVTPLESTDIADEVSEILESTPEEEGKEVAEGEAGATAGKPTTTLKQGRRGLVKKMQKDENDTGSTEVQIALLTGKINDLIKHLKEHNKDHDSRQGLLKMVGRRRRLLRFLHHGDPEKYEGLIKELNLRK